MPTTEARLATDRASRYLVQLCSHLSAMTSHQAPVGHGGDRAMPAVRQVECADTHGTVRFAGGRCALEATADALTLRIDADDEEALRRLQDGIGARIEKIGRRDGLQVHWRRVTAGAPPHTPLQDRSEFPR